MLTFKPAAGSYVHYEGRDTSTGAYLITSYDPYYPGVAILINMTTMKETSIIIDFSNKHRIEFNPRLTVIG